VVPWDSTQCILLLYFRLSFFVKDIHSLSHGTTPMVIQWLSMSEAHASHHPSLYLVQGYSEFLMENNSSPKSGTGFLKTCFNGVNALSGF
jgi:hypothetical protein